MFDKQKFIRLSLELALEALDLKYDGLSIEGMALLLVDLYNRECE